jgi:hypothetical protein
LQGFLLQIDETEIVVHEADEPNAVIDFLYAGALAGQHTDQITLNNDFEFGVAGDSPDLRITIRAPYRF